jgi:hypothetical protein
VIRRANHSNLRRSALKRRSRSEGESCGRPHRDLHRDRKVYWTSELREPLVCAKVDIDTFLEKGYAVVPQLFSPEEAEEIRRATIEETERLDRAGEAASVEGPKGRMIGPRGDMLTYEAFRRVLLDSRLVGVIREVLGDDPVFWGESGVWVGNSGTAHAWHTDAYETPVTKGPRYPLVRCGLYLEDTAAHSDGLALVEGSHAQDPLAMTFMKRLRRAALPWVGWLGPGRTRFVESRPGDLVIWDMRIFHAGEVVRFKPKPSLVLPLEWQRRLPRSLRLPEERRRVVMFPTFGLPGPDLDSYLEYQRSSREYMRDIWKASHFPDSVVEEAAAVGLRVIRPEPYYGRSDERGPQMQS